MGHIIEQTAGSVYLYQAGSTRDDDCEVSSSRRDKVAAPKTQDPHATQIVSSGPAVYEDREFQQSAVDESRYFSIKQMSNNHFVIANKKTGEVYPWGKDVRDYELAGPNARVIEILNQDNTVSLFNYKGGVMPGASRLPRLPDYVKSSTLVWNPKIEDYEVQPQVVKPKWRESIQVYPDDSYSVNNKYYECPKVILTPKQKMWATTSAIALGVGVIGTGLYLLQDGVSKMVPSMGVSDMAVAGVVGASAVASLTVLGLLISCMRSGTVVYAKSNPQDAGLTTPSQSKVYPNNQHSR